MGIECIGGIIVMVWYHSKLDKKYLVWKVWKWCNIFILFPSI
jgi:hypothetical protein